MDGGLNFRNIFALGDVAETGGPKMARAGLLQAEVVRSNILSLIAGGKLKEYRPIALEGSLKLSLGKVDPTDDSGYSYCEKNMLTKGVIRTSMWLT